MSAMSRRFAPILLVALAACGGEKAAPPSPALGAGAEGPPAVAAAPPVADPGSTYVDIGVPECDDYARKYLACLERTPEGSRAMMRQSFDQTRVALGPDGGKARPSRCPCRAYAAVLSQHGGNVALRLRLVSAI